LVNFIENQLFQLILFTIFNRKKMKKTILPFSILLILWIAGCAYCYVCNIRDDCRAATPPVAKTDTLTLPLKNAEIPPRLSLYFDFNGRKVILTGEDKKHIEEFKTYMAENPGSVVEISGHSDPVGAPQAKLKISTERAQFLQGELIAAGIEGSRINVQGKADTELASMENTADGNAKNRRVEIQIK
jgi:outer membrane protein OmpA-like peptidoglycan-associated protein